MTKARSRRSETLPPGTPVIAYVRVSTERDEMVSPEIQTSAIRAFVVEQGWRLVGQEQDLDVSGRDFARAGIARVFSSLAVGDAKAVLVYNYARFGRDLQQSILNITKVKASGGRVISTSERFDEETAVGQLSRNVMLSFAQFQSAFIGESWVAAQENRVAKGLHPHGVKQFGYEYHLRHCQCRLSPGCRKTHGIHPIEGPVLAEMYDRYLAGTGLSRLAGWLNSCDVATPRNAKWRASSVALTLDRGFGAGLINYRNEMHEGVHDRVISREVYDEYKQRRVQERKWSSVEKAAPYALTGLAVCSLCHGPMTCANGNLKSLGEKRRGYIYRCLNSQDCQTCPGVWRIRRDVEEAVLSFMDGFAAELEAEARDSLSQLQRRRTTAQPDLASKLAKVDGAIERLVQAVAYGTISEQSARETDKRLREDRHRLELELVELQNAPRCPAAPEVRALRDQWEDLPTGVRRKMVGVFVKRVVVFPRRQGPVVVEPVIFADSATELPARAVGPERR